MTSNEMNIQIMLCVFQHALKIIYKLYLGKVNDICILSFDSHNNLQTRNIWNT